MKDINEFLSNKGISLEKLEVDEPTSNLPYSVEEFDKVKTRVMKYVIYKKRTEQEVKTKFSSSIEKNASKYLLKTSGLYLFIFKI